MNVAKNKKAFQVSDYWTSFGPTFFYCAASFGSDGNAYVDISGQSCVNTQEEDFAWWMVDLAASYSIHTVFITNRNSARTLLVCLS